MGHESTIKESAPDPVIVPQGFKHTPGPWRTQGWVPTWAYIPVKDARHNLVCSLYPDVAHGYTREEVQANAILITEAPAMLAALQLALDALTDGETSEPFPYLPAIEAARAAIARATGATS